MKAFKVIGKDFKDRVNTWLDIKKVEDDVYKGSTFVGEFALAEGSEMSASVFYQPNPPEPFKNNYFGIYMNPFSKSVFIFDATKIASKERTGILTKNGNLIYSRNRHDYVTQDDCMIDGGDAYLRCSFGDKSDTLVRFKIDKTDFKIVDSDESE